MLLSLPRTLTTLAIIALLSVASEGHAQVALDILGQQVAVGSERKVVLAKLSQFRLQCIGESSATLAQCDSVLVQGTAPRYDAYANVYFQQDRVKSVRKYWSRGYEGTDPGNFVQALFTVLSELSRETGIAPTVTVAERRDPGILQQSMFISAGRRSITISYTEGFRGSDGKIIPPFVNLDERIE